jgi:hypothetical protein
MPPAWGFSAAILFWGQDYRKVMGMKRHCSRCGSKRTCADKMTDLVGDEVVEIPVLICEKCGHSEIIFNQKESDY